MLCSGSLLLFRPHPQQLVFSCVLCHWLPFTSSVPCSASGAFSSLTSEESLSFGLWIPTTDVSLFRPWNVQDLFSFHLFCPECSDFVVESSVPLSPAPSALVPSAPSASLDSSVLFLWLFWAMSFLKECQRFMFFVVWGLDLSGSSAIWCSSAWSATFILASASSSLSSDFDRALPCFWSVPVPSFFLCFCARKF